VSLRGIRRRNLVSAHASDNALESARETKHAALNEDTRRPFLLSKFGRQFLFGALVLAGCAGFLAGFGVGSKNTDRWLTTWPEPPSIQTCISDTLHLMGDPKPPNIDLLHQLVGHCYSLNQSQGVIRDFGTRELIYAQQYRANGILMWMVVIITLSGVLLAAIQLSTSYKLALTLGHRNEMTNEISLTKDAIILRSSITGLIILGASFGFFLVYVLYVYRLDRSESTVDRSYLVRPVDGLGPPRSGDEKH